MSRTIERIKPFLEWIEKEWNKQPDLRFTQLCISLGIVPNTPGGWFHREDYSLPTKHEDVRKITTWGTYGQEGKSKFKVLYLKDMDTEHIKACLSSGDMYGEYESIFEDELKYRGGKDAVDLDK